MHRHHHGLPWPRLREREEMACEFCDAIQEVPRLNEGDAAYCGNCGEMLFQNRPRSLHRATGYSIAALLFMGMSQAFPFLIMSAAGNKTALSLMGCVQALDKDGEPLLALFFLLFTTIAPFILILGIFYLCAPLLYGGVLPGAVLIARWSLVTEPWSMLEVFLLGFIVSLLKLGDLAQIEFHIGLWALVAAVLCIAGATAGIDRRELWDRIEIAKQPKKTSKEAIS